MKPRFLPSGNDHQGRAILTYSACGPFSLWRLRVRVVYEFLFQPVQFRFREIFQIHQVVARALSDADQFVELQMHHFGVAILRVLNQEDHQEGDDRRTRVDDELPRIGVAEYRPSRPPGDDDNKRDGECPRRAHNM